MVCKPIFYKSFNIINTFDSNKISLVLLFNFAELKDAKQTSPVNKNDLSVDHHHQHNGKIKSALSLCPDKNEKNSEIDTTNSVNIPSVDGDKAKNICIDIESKVNDVEIVNPEENAVVANVEENNKEAEDKYVHSLWKWPTGRSWLTKVTLSNFIWVKYSNYCRT